MRQVVWRVTATLLVLVLVLGALALTTRTTSGQDRDDIASQGTTNVLLNRARMVLPDKAVGWKFYAYTEDLTLRDNVRAMAPSLEYLLNRTPMRYEEGLNGRPLYDNNGCVLAANPNRQLVTLQRTGEKDEAGLELHLVTINWSAKASDLEAARLRSIYVLAREIRMLRPRVTRLESAMAILWQEANVRNRAAGGTGLGTFPALVPEQEPVQTVRPVPTPEVVRTTPTSTPPVVEVPKATTTPTPAASPAVVAPPSVVPTSSALPTGTITAPSPGAELVKGSYKLSGVVGSPDARTVEIRLGGDKINTRPVASDRTWAYKSSLTKPGQYVLEAIEYNAAGAEVGRSSSNLTIK